MSLSHRYMHFNARDCFSAFQPHNGIEQWDLHKIPAATTKWITFDHLKRCMRFVRSAKWKIYENPIWTRGFYFAARKYLVSHDWKENNWEKNGSFNVNTFCSCLHKSFMQNVSMAEKNWIRINKMRKKTLRVKNKKNVNGFSQYVIVACHLHIHQLEANNFFFRFILFA